VQVAGDIHLDELKALPAQEMLDVLGLAGAQVVQTDHFAAGLKVGLAEVRPDEPCTAGDDKPALGHALASTYCRGQ
jgi:hypothetical protein